MSSSLMRGARLHIGPAEEHRPLLKKIPFLTPRLPSPSVVARDYADIVSSGVFTNGGPREALFAAQLATWIGNDVAVSVTCNATMGLQLAYRALFRPNRRLVLVASFTCPAAALALRWCGYEPVFVDIARKTWQPDHLAAEAFLERHADAMAGIILSNTFGVPNTQIDRWEDLAQRWGLALIIDSAAGFGATYPWGEPLGARGDCEVFSFHATKTFAVGEGGAVSARDANVIRRLDRMKNFGFDASRQSVEVGTNGKLPELGSAMGIRQLAAIPHRIAVRAQVLRWYVDRLIPLGFEFQPGLEGAAPPFVSTLLPRGMSRDQLGRALDKAGVGWRAYYDPPVHRHPSFVTPKVASDLLVTNEIARRIISLPLDDDLSAEDVDTIVGIVRGDQ